MSPAGSKIEYITLTTGCPEGWLLKGAVNADKSFLCAPIPDASAPTNLIHCIDGMKYFAKDGHVGCRHPQLPAPEPEKFAKAKTPPAKSKAPARTGESNPRTTTPPIPKAQGKTPAKAAESHARATTPPLPKAQGKAPARTTANSKDQPQIKSAEAPN